MEMDSILFGGSTIRTNIKRPLGGRGRCGGIVKTNTYAQPCTPEGAGQKVKDTVLEEVYQSMNWRRGFQHDNRPASSSIIASLHRAKSNPFFVPLPPPGGPLE